MPNFRTLCACLILVSFALTSCEDLLKDHPWEIRVPDDRKDLNNTNIAIIEPMLDSSFTFAVIGDPHFYYDELEDIVESVKIMTSASFAIVNGDLTDQAQMQEFLWYTDAMREEIIPYISVIGNHDHLANGRHIYEEMFGARNQVFEMGGTRFVLFDNIEFESDIEVDYPWLNQVLGTPFAGHTLVFMHIQPTDVQLQGEPNAKLDAIMEEHKPSAVYMGHLHSYDSQSFTGGTTWATAPWPRNREYLEVHVTPDTVYHQLRAI